MVNEVANVNATGGALAAANALKGKLQKAKASIPDVQGSQYLRFLQDGDWVFGQENEGVLPEDKVAVNTLSIKTGWSCWTDRPGKGAKNDNLGEMMVPLGADAIAKSDLPVKRDASDNNAICEWREQFSVDMMILTGPNKGKQVHYKTTSVGGMGAMNAMLDQVMLQLDEDPANIVPVVSLGSDHYNHKKWGRTYTPVIKIKDWMSLDDDAMTPDEEEADAPEPKTETPKARTRKAAPVEEPEDDETDPIEGEIVDDEQDEQPEEPRRRRRR